MMKIKTLIFLYLLISTICWLPAQKILLVDDNDYILYNSDTIINDISATGYTFTVYNIEKNGGIAPSKNKLLEYDIVIWYTSTDGVLLNFWDSNNIEAIKNYIDSGKLFWVVGLDLLFDKYGLPPQQFFETEFSFDYLGVANYMAQSYGNDGQKGCPEMNKSISAPASFSSNIKWTFPTLWWADACEITPFSNPIYVMGPSNYALSGGVSMHYNQMNNRKVLCTFFDPALIDTYINRVAFLKATIAFMNLETSVKNQDIKSYVKLYPNPAISSATINSEALIESLKLINMNGQEVMSLYDIDSREKTIDLSSYAQGIYVLHCKIKEGIISYHKLIINQ